MKKQIQIIDLPALHAPIKMELDAAIEQVLNHQHFVNGEEVKLFERELGHYLNAKVLGVGNGTDALEIALQTLGVGTGDEVLVPSFSYFASVEVINKVGAIPVFVDIDETYTISVADLEKKITSKCKCIIAVHLYGMPAHMESIMDFASVNNLKVIEDTAQAIGATCLIDGKRHKVGTIGDLGTISFFPSKNLGAFGDGGAIVSNNSQLLEKAKMLAQHGQSSKYVHEIIGSNSRLDTLQAAVLRAKLPYLDQWNARRLEIAKQYVEGLEPNGLITIIPVPEYATHVYHQFTLVVEGNRNQYMQELQSIGVPVRLYYPKAIHQQRMFSHLQPELPVTERIQAQMISLPIHPTLTNAEVQFVVDSVNKVICK